MLTSPPLPFPERPVRLLLVAAEAHRLAHRDRLQPSTDPIFDVTEAATIQEALDHCLRHRPECLLLDERGLDDGAGLLQTLHDALPSLPPVLLVTADAASGLTDVEAVFTESQLGRLPGALRRAAERARLREALARERAARQDLEAQRTKPAAVEPAFLADLSHDLRSPLNALIGYVDLLHEELADEEMLLEDVDRLRHLAGRLLDTVAGLDAVLEQTAPADAPVPTALATEPEEAPLPDAEDGVVLVIDDDDDLRELMARYLETEGFAVATASDGDEGLRLARQIRPAAITLDVEMPGMDGWDVLERLKADRVLADTPVIMLTGRGSERVAAEALRMGVDAYLMKGDITAPALLNALTEALAKGRHRAAGAG